MLQVSEALATAIADGNPQRVLLEFKTNGSYENPTRFSNADIAVERGVTLRETFNGDTELSVGQCPSAVIRFTLLNDVNQVTEFEFGEFKAWLGAAVDTSLEVGEKTMLFTDGDGVSRTYEFAPLGVFIAERPNVVRKQMIDIEAYDQMSLFEKDWPSDDCGITFGTDATMSAILTAMCAKVGVTLATTTFTNSGLALTAKPKGIENITMKEMLSWIAEAAGSVARFNRNGQLEIAWFGTTPVQTYSEGDYVEFEPSWYEVAAVDKLSVRNADATRESVFGTGTNGYVIQNNPFLRAT